MNEEEKPLPPRFRVVLTLEDQRSEEGKLTGFKHWVQVINADTDEEVTDPTELVDTPSLHGLMVATKTWFAMHERAEANKKAKERGVILPEDISKPHSVKFKTLVGKGKGKK